jgi:hypothetical protein
MKLSAKKNTRHARVIIAALAIAIILFSRLTVNADVGTVDQPIPPGGSTIDKPLPQSSSQPTFTLSNPLKVSSIGELVQNFVQIFSYIVILLAVLMLIYVGFLYVMSQGKPDKRKELNSWLLWIVVGVAVVISARLIINIVINTLSASGTVDSNVIQSARNAASGN